MPAQYYSAHSPISVTLRNLQLLLTNLRIQCTKKFKKPELGNGIVPTTVTFIPKLLPRRDLYISPKDKPLRPNCASGALQTKAFLSCYTDMIFFLIFALTKVTFALHDVAVSLLTLQNRRNKMKSRSGEVAFQQTSRSVNAVVWQNVLRRSFPVSVDLNDIACD